MFVVVVLAHKASGVDLERTPRRARSGQAGETYGVDRGICVGKTCKKPPKNQVFELRLQTGVSEKGRLCDNATGVVQCMCFHG